MAAEKQLDNRNTKTKRNGSQGNHAILAMVGIDRRQ